MRVVQASSGVGVRWSAGDLTLATLLFVGTVAYAATLPTNMAPPDEATYLLEAKRLRDGDVMYRDVFDFTTPGYPFALLVARIKVGFGEPNHPLRRLNCGQR